MEDNFFLIKLYFWSRGLPGSLWLPGEHLDAYGLALITGVATGRLSGMASFVLCKRVHIIIGKHT